MVMATLPYMPDTADGLFVEAAQWNVPGIASRYRYKKDPGSSDTRHQEDTIRT